MITLGIETSCDDTSICILETKESSSERPRILAHLSFSQERMLQKWGGVVPEIAARNHLAKVTPLLEEAFNEANIHPSSVDQIGVTTHPGLLGPLLTGVNAAKTLSLMYKTPINPVNHLFAHLEAIHLTEEVSGAQRQVSSDTLRERSGSILDAQRGLGTRSDQRVPLQFKVGAERFKSSL